MSITLTPTQSTGMTLAEATKIVRASIPSGTNTSLYPDVDIYRAILSVGNDFVSRTNSLFASATVSLVTDVANYTISSFRPEDVVDAELRYVDQGAWADSTAYLVNDMVTHNNKTYRVTNAHTGPGDVSTEPGVGDDWRDFFSPLESDAGYEVEVVNYTAISVRHNHLHHHGHGHGHLHLHDPDIITGEVTQGRPWLVAFNSLTEVYVEPVPDERYSLVFTVQDSFPDFDPESVDATTQSLLIPDRYIRPMLRDGVGSELMMTSDERSHQRIADQRLNRYEQHVLKVAGMVGFGEKQYLGREDQYV